MGFALEPKGFFDFRLVLGLHGLKLQRKGGLEGFHRLRQGLDLGIPVEIQGRRMAGFPVFDDQKQIDNDAQSDQNES